MWTLSPLLSSERESVDTSILVSLVVVVLFVVVVTPPALGYVLSEIICVFICLNFFPEVYRWMQIKKRLQVKKNFHYTLNPLNFTTWMDVDDVKCIFEMSTTCRTLCEKCDLGEESLVNN